MHVAETRVRSERASRYLVQLCKHFSHKTDADFDETRGHVDFQPGLCVMNANGDQLSLRCEAASETDLDRVKEIVTNHLERFAQQDEIILTWADIPSRTAS